MNYIISTEFIGRREYEVEASTEREAKELYLHSYPSLDEEISETIVNIKCRNPLSRRRH